MINTRTKVGLFAPPQLKIKNCVDPASRSTIRIAYNAIADSAVDIRVFGARSVLRGSNVCSGFDERRCQKKILRRALPYHTTLVEHNDTITINYLPW